MTFEEAKTIFLNRGYIEVDGGSYFDGNKWRESVIVISEWLKEEPGSNNGVKIVDNLCDSCANIGCEFQSGIVRTKCAFYMPPHIEPDNCGNYVVQNSTTQIRKARDEE